MSARRWEPNERCLNQGLAGAIFSSHFAPPRTFFTSPLRKMCHSTITISLSPDPTPGGAATPAEVQGCNPFFLTKLQCRELEDVISKLKTLITEGDKLQDLKERLLRSMTAYSLGEFARDKTRLSNLNSYLDHYDSSLCGPKNPSFNVKAFVLASLSNNHWILVHKYKQEFWAWAMEKLANVAEPPRIVGKLRETAIDKDGPFSQNFEDLKKDSENVLKAVYRRKLDLSRSSSVLETASSLPRIETAQVRHQQQPVSSPPITSTVTALQAANMSRRENPFQSPTPAHEYVSLRDSPAHDGTQGESANTQGRLKRRRTEGSFEHAAESGPIMEAQQPAPRVTQVGQEPSLSNERGRSITADSPRTYAVSRDHALRQLATSERASERNSQTASHTPMFQQQFDGVTLHPMSGPAVTTGWHVAAHGYDTVGAPCNQETFRESYNAAQYANAMPATGQDTFRCGVSDRGWVSPKCSCAGAKGIAGYERMSGEPETLINAFMNTITHSYENTMPMHSPRRSSFGTQ
ncbi:hypothetical protein B0J12DRAFT_688852 [Macrophomina phaseolina]|uniref:Uncharacterized protein n=1 Tax=Macrophomina phaseolina TaxID=35725 RepID=A0ABQ8FRD3_9PEZI|nr:hypothetical protein B0J12DRAFT_688852 [Macrophomina phaseolina]